MTGLNVVAVNVNIEGVNTTVAAEPEPAEVPDTESDTKEEE